MRTYRRRSRGLAEGLWLLCALALLPWPGSALEAQQRRYLVELGAGVTNVSVFAGGMLVGLKSLPIGGIDITDDIASAFGTRRIEAERMKCFYGSATTSPRDNHDMIELAPIGGAEDKDGNPDILARFVELAGGSSADALAADYEVPADPDPAAHESHIRLFLLGSAFGIVLHQRGLHVGAALGDYEAAGLDVGADGGAPGPAASHHRRRHRRRRR